MDQSLNPQSERPPSALLFAAVADDDTGASDLAGMLAERGARTLLVIDLPPVEKFREWSRGYDAVVLAEGTRNVAPAAAYERTRAAVRLALWCGPRLFQIKYCSTFDSTAEGNIGPSIDAALDELGEEFTVAPPALPVNGRTTYRGRHFVHGRPLDESPMRHHPLTPMSDADLVRHLGRQTRRAVGLAPLEAVEAGADALKKCFADLRGRGVSVAVVDCLCDRHVETVCRAAEGLRLVTGSSAFGMGLPPLWRERGLLAERAATRARAEDERARDEYVRDEYARDTRAGDERAGGERERDARAGGGAGCLIVAGSCSEATRRQNEWLAREGAAVRRVDPPELLTGEFGRAALVAEARRELETGRHFLLTTSGGADDVRRAQEWGAGRGLDAAALGAELSGALADLAREVCEGARCGGLVVAGGETSGAVCRRLELGALAVGRNIEPGVPLCRPLGRFRAPVVLKSGNFGGADFYSKAVAAVRRAEEFFVN